MLAIKKALLGILVVTVAGTGLYVAVNRGIIKGQAFESFFESTEKTVGPVADSVGQQAETLNKRSQEVGGHVQKVLGTYVQSEGETTTGEGESGKNASSAPSPPLHEKAFEYGRYLYCQQVVKDYESRYSKSSEQE